MKIENIYLDKLDWAVFIVHSVNSADVEEISSILYKFGCPDNIIKKAKDNISKEDCNNGFIYNDTKNNISIILIGEVSSMSQLANTIVHEGVHLIRFLSSYFEMSEEECATYVGNFTMKIIDRI